MILRGLGVFVTDRLMDRLTDGLMDGQTDGQTFAILEKICPGLEP